MSHVYENAAIRVIDWLHHAERDLIGHEIKTFTGRVGIVHGVKLDEHHGLCFTLRGTDHPERRWYPVSTIKYKEPIK